ncbi:MAG: putative rane protein [Firmicutes bacterium]|nr:putative rane protein [Bacillota bacterium]
MVFIVIPLISPQKGRLFLQKTIYVICWFILLTALSQLGLLIWSPNFENLVMINPYDSSKIFRSTMFTQALYLLAAFSTFLFSKLFYKRQWDKYIFSGVIFLALYGLFEFIYFLIFNQNGDFISNRVFGDGEIGSGSLFQTMTIGGLGLERLKSLTGEPSMYAFTVLPFWIYTLHTRNKCSSLLFLVTLILSTSTTAIIGIIIYLLVRFRYFGIKDSFIKYFLILLMIVIILIGPIIMDVIQLLVVDKITLTNISGIDRYNNFINSMDFFINTSIISKLFGVGFGYIRSTDMFSTLIVNNGIIGFSIISMIFGYPLWKLENNYRNIGLKASLIVIYFTMMISVSEFSYLSIWLFLGMAYNQVDLERNRM